jgi:aromatic ring-opening dioxygenase LigB subunit
MLNFIGISPFSPALVPEINKKDHLLIKKTIIGLEKLSEELARSNPETIIFVSPRGPMRYDKFTINTERKLCGSFGSFGLKNQEDHSYSNDFNLAKKIFKKLRSQDFPVETVHEDEIDYGTLVPLHFFNKKLKNKPKIIILTFTSLSWDLHFQLGKFLKEILKDEEKNIAFIASGDLSQRLSDNSPEEYSPYGLKFDQTLIKLLKTASTEKILKLNPDFCREAGEIGLRSIIIALGLINQGRYSFFQISYEAPLGGGYLVGRWKIR